MPLKRPRAQAKNVMMLHHHSWITGEHSRLKKFLLKHSIQRDRKKWLPWKNNCAAQWQFSKRPKNITKTTRETIWLCTADFKDFPISLLTINLNFLTMGISYKICFTNECLELWKAWQRPSLFCLSFPICRTYNHCILRFACTISPHKLPNIKFFLAPIIVHEADFSKHRPLFPTLIMYSTNRPHAACNNVKKGINFTLQCCVRMGGVGAVGCKTLILSV